MIDRDVRTVETIAEKWRKEAETPFYYHCDHAAVGILLERVRQLEEAAKAKVVGSRAEILPYQSIPHISRVNFTRAIRWHPAGITEWSLSDWFTALAGEVGEAGNIIKKLNRYRDKIQQKGTPEKDELQEKLKMEIGDVFMYLDLLARRAGFNLEDCIRDTFNRVSVREGFPERL